MRSKHWLLLTLLALWWSAPLSAQDLRPFKNGSYQTIVDTHGERPFVLAFWSIDCPPCYKELKMFGELLRSQPFDLVLVSTDGPGATAEAQQVLAKFDLAEVDAWIFAAPPERLRFEIDRTWYGELPRSYLFAAGRREAVSGAIKATVLATWLKQHQR